MLEIDDETKPYLQEVKDFAAKSGREKDLQEMLDYLAAYACGEGDEYDHAKTKCVLYKDWAPLSFGFTMYIRKAGKYTRWFNGGLLFHGKHDGFGLGSSPTFAVTLNPTDGWSIHT